MVEEYAGDTDAPLKQTDASAVEAPAREKEAFDEAF